MFKTNFSRHKKLGVTAPNASHGYGPATQDNCHLGQLSPRTTVTRTTATQSTPI